MGRGQIVYNLGKKRFCQLLDHMGACLVKNRIHFFVYVILRIILKAKVKLCCFLEKPEIVLEPTDVDVQFGTTAYLTCRAVGDPQPEIKWLHNKSVFTFLISVAILYPFVQSSFNSVTRKQ